ncbi:MAG TPA: hypothetical protein VH500_22140 [Nitrososphaeraceae archaeon]
MGDKTNLLAKYIINTHGTSETRQEDHQKHQLFIPEWKLWRLHIRADLSEDVNPVFSENVVSKSAK